MPHKKRAQQSVKEIRVSKAPQKLAVRRSKDGSRSIEGLFCTYGTLSHDLGGFRERLAPGCFDKSLRQQPMNALVNHDDNKLLGKTGQNLTVVSDDTGLRFRVNPLPDTSYSQDLVALAEQGLVDSCSFGFVCIDDVWSTLPDGTPLRTITEAVVFEGSVLAGPDAAYPSTSVSLRAQRRAKAKRDDLLDDDAACDPDSPDYDADECEDEDRCECRCKACSEDRCERCSAEDCADEQCAADGCQYAGETETLRLRLRLHQHRRHVQS
jgi:HK97 family phage prohead protease